MAQDKISNGPLRCPANYFYYRKHPVVISES